MVWSSGGSVSREGKRHSIPLTSITPLAAPEVSFFDGEVRDCVVGAPACLSFIALPLSAQSSSSSFSTSVQCLPSPVVDRFALAALPPLMDSLLPSPFSSSSLAAFFPAHLPSHHCTEASSSPAPVLSSAALLSVSPSVSVRWRRKVPEVGAAGSSESVIRLSSHTTLASLASSLPPFSSAEKAFVVEGKEGLKISQGRIPEHDDGGGGPLPVFRNFMAGNARCRKEATIFFKQLPSELRGIQRKNFGGAAKKKDGVDTVFEGALSAGNEKRAESIREGQRKAVQTSKHLLAGAVAAMVSRTTVAPLERLKLEYLVRGAKGSVHDTVRAIFLTEGVRGFWKGNGMNILRTAPFKAVNFFCYDTYRRQLLRFGGRTEVTHIERLATGAAAGVTATLLCFPLDTIRILIVARGGETLGGMRGCFRHLIRTEGIGGLYKGLPTAVVSMAPAGAVFYGVYDILKSAYLTSPKGKAMLEARRKKARERPDEYSKQLELGTLRTLLFGAIAGACSETVTYPLEVVRRTQQMQFAGNKLGMIATFQVLMKKGGVGALYAGILPSTMQVLPSAALSYFVYETVKMAFEIP